MAVTVSGTSITFNDATVQTTAAGIPSVSAGTNYQASITSIGLGSSSMTKLLAIEMLCNGTVRIQWRTRQNNAADSAFSRIYKNGVAVSAEVSTVGSRFDTADISVVYGDAIQIYGRTSLNYEGALVSVHGFNVGVSNTNMPSLMTPVISPYGEASGFSGI